MRKQLLGLTAVRAVAAFWVATHHAFLNLEGVHLPENEILYNAAIKGWLMVDMFFILSGFIISYVSLGKVSLLRPSSIGEFMVKRFARIYPAHLAVLLVFALMAAAAVAIGKGSSLGPGYTMGGFFEQLFMLNGIGLSEPMGWNLPSWSVSSEALAYLFFPLLALILTIVRSARGAGLILLSILGTNIFLAWKINVGQKYMLDFEFTSVRVLSEFLMGMCLFRIYESIKNQKLGLSLLIAGTLGVVFQLTVDDSFYDFMYLVNFCALILGLALMDFKRPIPVLNFLGEVSYSLYLVHSLVIIVLNQVIRSSTFLLATPEVSLLLFVGGSVIGATLLYRLVEKPGQRLVTSLYKKRIGKQESPALRPVLARPLDGYSPKN